IVRSPGKSQLPLRFRRWTLSLDAAKSPLKILVQAHDGADRNNIKLINADNGAVLAGEADPWDANKFLFSATPGELLDDETGTKSGNTPALIVTVQEPFLLRDDLRELLKAE